MSENVNEKKTASKQDAENDVSVSISASASDKAAAKNTGNKSRRRNRKAGQKKRTISEETKERRDIKKLASDNEDKLIYGLDIGTRSIVGTVGFKDEEGRFTVIALESRPHTTRAMLDGQIHDIDQVAAGIREVTDKLNVLTGLTLTNVCIAAAGRVLRTIHSESVIEFDIEKRISGDEVYSLEMQGIKNAYDKLNEEVPDNDFYCVGYSVINYYQNNYVLSSLTGHNAKSIKADMIVTFLPEEVVDGLYASVRKAGLKVKNLTLEPIAAINAAIPQNYRLLNLGLVDVGAGTSDISITRDGSVVAYGMIPMAGDEITEALSREYLLSFDEAERVKCAPFKDGKEEYHDIMDLPHTLTLEEFNETIKDVIKEETGKIADKIKELNGDRPVSAVFIVGGGGKVPGFSEALAAELGIKQERVAVRGEGVLKDIKFVQRSVHGDSLLVTPVGICLNFYEQRNNFIFVTVNGETVKLYDNGKLTVMDAAMKTGFPDSDLFPKRGDSIQFSVNGESRLVRGEPGEAAVILVNGQVSSLSTHLRQDDVIEIKASTAGPCASVAVKDLPEYHKTIKIKFNDKEIDCPVMARVNGELVLDSFAINEGDRVEMQKYYLVSDILKLMDIEPQGSIMVNHEEAFPDTKVYENFTVQL
ncbi:MAG: pilus assembly protein PilM [Lachnospiraceae bacterium]|jgi:cell division protein FtsA|nr:pilus assembly protein PilM [Lachnospiraceae bacterium]MEE3460793.1 pilus assembly protein PilM [Lachnospiraceae bacterium]